MRSKATQRIKDRKRIARRRKIVRCTNLGVRFGEAMRMHQRNIGSFFDLAEPSLGPRRRGAKDWDE